MARPFTPSPLNGLAIKRTLFFAASLRRYIFFKNIFQCNTNLKKNLENFYVDYNYFFCQRSYGKNFLNWILLFVRPKKLS